MPRRKSGIGRQSGDGFGKPKPVKGVSEYRQSSRWSFRAPKSNPDLRQLNDECGFEDIPTDRNLLHNQGRKEGELPLYDPVQIKNYTSQNARYEAALNLSIHSIDKSTGRTIYRFCSKASPTGFWEVAVSGATYITITKPILTIICPKPFKLADVGSGIQTDSDSLVWEQLQGRLTIISPESGNGSLDPTFVILPAARDPLEPPILIRVSLSSDASIGDTLAIRTTATSTQYGIDSNVLDWGQDPCRAVQRIFLLPSGVSQAIAYDGTYPLPVGWFDPTCAADQTTLFRWQSDTTGQYLDVQSFLPSDNKRFLAYPGVRYRVMSDRLYRGIPSSIDSPRFQLDVPVGGRLILADEIIQKISSTTIEGKHDTKPYSLLSLPVTDHYTSGVSSGVIEGRHATTPYTLVSLPVGDRYTSAISSTAIEGRHQVTQSGGVVIG